MYFQADITAAHDAEKYRSQQREISSEKIRHSGYVSVFSFFGNSNLKYGLGFSRLFIIDDDDTVTFIVHTVLCLLNTFNSQTNRKPLELEPFA